MFSLGKKKPIVNHNDIDDDEDEDDILNTIEIVVKSTKIDIKDLLSLIKTATAQIPSIQELKQEIKELKQELKQQQEFNKELVLKLIDKPSAAAQYLANKAVAAAPSSATAGPKGKLP